MISDSVNVRNNSVNNTPKRNQQNPSFKGFGAMNFPGWAMNKIETGGFITSFLIQDTLGMTCPRTREGLKRDREKHTKFKDLNFKEGAEVFIREFLSGPLMVFTPFFVFLATKKFLGKSTFVNTELISKMGKNFATTIRNKSAEHTAADIKENFYRSTIKEMLEHSTPNGKNQDSTVDKLYGFVQKLDDLEGQLGTAKGKTFGQKVTNLFKRKANRFKSEKDIIKEQISETQCKIIEELNSYHKTNSDNFDLANRVKLENGTFGSQKAVDAMRAYAYDATKKNPVQNWEEKDANNLAKWIMTKRIFSTLAASIATIGSTSIVPSLYALLNPVPPGALDQNCSNPEHKHDNKVTESGKIQNQNTNKSNVQFKGNVLKHLQYDGNQVTPLLMTALAGGGLVFPRLNTAVKRAPIDEDGKKNLIEVPEIIARDLTSIIAVTFGVPVLTKFMVDMYKNKSGFVLMNKPEKEMSIAKKVLDYINPISSIEPYSISDIKQIYGNISNKDQLSNFAKFIDNNDGSLLKVFKKLHNGKQCFSGTDADFSTLGSLSRKDANTKIMQVIESAFDDAKVTELMKPKAGSTLNGMVKYARNLNSLPKFINTIVLVPAFLGVILPKIVYGITAKNRAMQEQAKLNRMNNQLNVVQQANAQNSKVENTTFKQMKHNVG